MSTVLLVLVILLVLVGLVYGVISLLSGEDPALVPADPDGVARPLPNNRSLTEQDLKTVRFDVELRGYRMSQVDRVLRRTAYDVGYKDEMIAVLEAEVAALREGRREDADLLRKARESAASTTPAPATDRPAGGAHRARASDDVLADDEDQAFDGEPVVEETDEAVEVDEAYAESDETYTGAGRLNRAALRHHEAADEPDEAEVADGGADADAADVPDEADLAAGTDGGGDVDDAGDLDEADDAPAGHGEAEPAERRAHA